MSGRGVAPTTDLAWELRTQVNRLAYHLRSPATRSGVTPTRLAALAALARTDRGCRQGDLAAQMGMSAPSMTRLAEILLEAGWVTRERDPDDQRAQLLRLSEGGLATLEGVRAESRSRLSHDVADLTAAQRRTLAAAIPILSELADRWLDADTTGAPSA